MGTSMTCERCHSAMVLETFVDLGSGGNPGAFLGWRCVTCGAIVDPVIAQHQRVMPAPTVWQGKGKAGRGTRKLTSTGRSPVSRA